MKTINKSILEYVFIEIFVNKSILEDDFIDSFVNTLLWKIGVKKYSSVGG